MKKIKELIKSWGLTNIILGGTLGGYMTYVFILAIINTICDCIQKGTMNIFFLDKTPDMSAKYLCDKHVPKMLLETCQMLSTAVQKYTGRIEDLYKPAYPKHPSTIWAGTTRHNFVWLLEHGLEIDYQYWIRYKKKHKSSRILDLIVEKGMDRVLPRSNTEWITTPPQCMPDEYKHEDYITAYRNYYKGAKRYFAKWDKLNNKPDWWTE